MTVEKHKERIIGQWVALHTKDLLSWAYSRTSDKMLAEDLVQDVFMIAVHKFDSFKEESAPKTWLFAILNNKIAEHYRKLASGSAVSTREGQDSNFTNDGKWHDHARPRDWKVDDQKQLLDNPEFLNVWYACMDELPKLQSTCMRLKFVSDVDSATICADLNISSSNYWQLLRRGRLQLRKCLEKSWFNK